MGFWLRCDIFRWYYYTIHQLSTEWSFINKIWMCVSLSLSLSPTFRPFPVFMIARANDMDKPKSVKWNQYFNSNTVPVAHMPRAMGQNSINSNHCMVSTKEGKNHDVHGFFSYFFLFGLLINDRERKSRWMRVMKLICYLRARQIYVYHSFDWNG